MNNNEKSKFKYLDLKNYLVGMISSGKYAPGACIESENMLGARWGLSRNTVRQAIKELEVEGYLYRLQGKGTFIRETNPGDLRKIALIIYDTAYMVHPITANLIRGIDEVLVANNYALDVLASKRGFHEEKTSALFENYAGILVGAYQIDALLMREFTVTYRPCLFVKNYTDATLDRAVRIDYERAGFLAAEHLIHHSRRDFGLIYFGESVTIARDFANGARKAALEYGARMRAQNIAAIPYGQTGQVGPALSKFDHPDGLLCFADEFAVAACNALKERNIKVPEDVAVVGCNNTSASLLYSPPITTIDIPTFELGRLAAQALLEVIQGKKFDPVLLEPELVVRSTSGGVDNVREGA